MSGQQLSSRFAELRLAGPQTEPEPYRDPAGQAERAPAETAELRPRVEPRQPAEAPQAARVRAVEPVAWAARAGRAERNPRVGQVEVAARAERAGQVEVAARAGQAEVAARAEQAGPAPLRTRLLRHRAVPPRTRPRPVFPSRKTGRIPATASFPPSTTTTRCM
jgi:hypothetical protein